MADAAPIETQAEAPHAEAKKVLAIDIGGSKAKFLVSGEHEPRRVETGRGFTPQQLVDAIRDHTQDWDYQCLSIGYPGFVGDNGPRSEPGNLSGGWVGFNFAAAFQKPVRILNDASMQALGSYEGGRMLFLGLGTGLGSTLIADNVIVPLELGGIPAGINGKPLYRDLGRAGMRRIGKRMWRRLVGKMVGFFSEAFLADYVVLGGGNSKYLRKLPGNARLGHNLTAFRGGFRLWEIDDIRTQCADAHPHGPVTPADAPWRLI
ncbi:MAG: ROK family protein [Gemmataceae bacterium]|nr:ROK family protein [Gemmataceae bacterium]